ncbi:MAG TPA: HlyD family efflux transporter periplasmic adaptor subunit [Candidatus Paceibacterota bacterium]|nr:HlyD family efflux transporter periplasmic adaptor subunit [Candidatus Paceibacterota bacterium]
MGVIKAMRAHKIITGIVVIVVVGGGYYWYSAANVAPTVTKYVVEDATDGTIVASVSATGQVQAGTTIDVTPKVSETVTSIPVTVGEHVNQGQLLVQLDPTNEKQALQQAQLALEQAQLSLQETQQISTTTLLQEQDAVTTGQQSVVNASTTLIQDYQSGFNNLGPTFVNLQTVMVGLQNFVEGNDLSKTQEDPDAFVSLMPSYLQPGVVPYETTLEGEYTAAVAAYQQNLADYQAVTSSSSHATMDSLFSETLNTAQTISDAVTAGKNFLTYVVNTYPSNSSSTKPLPAITNTFQTNFSAYTTTMTSAVSGVQSTVTQIESDKNNIVNTQNSLQQASETLSELVAGPTQTTLLGQQISVQSAENNLTTAQQNLDYTSVTAPIAGTVSAISATVGETAGSDAVTIVGDGQVAEVTLNEIDAAKVSLGDPATLTFDALPNLSLAGQVVEIDPVGTVSQGVVSYNVQIGFSQPANTSSTNLVKPGMSVTANIVTQVDQNVIAVPNAAVVTSSGGSSYILEPSTPLSAADLALSANGGIVLAATKEVPVTVGLANDTMTEIDSGVNVGDQIIVQTIKSAATTKTTATAGTSALQLLGGAGAARTGGGGGFTRGAAVP